jgi:hypothetical protein
MTSKNVKAVMFQIVSIGHQDLSNNKNEVLSVSSVVAVLMLRGYSNFCETGAIFFALTVQQVCT